MTTTWQDIGTEGRPTRVLVCGGRDYRDRATFVATMDRLDSLYQFTTVIHGMARGADHEAEVWGVSRDKTMMRFPADWDASGRAAGPLRNQAMIDEGRPDIVVAFPGGRGTADMVARARKAGLLVTEFT